ncbi:MAG: hypothetical protein QOJ97_868, partial [Solirubrobacteraceae bacterium]|nr:hypothetical protein [Solirubrobacteraceae bacterium]
NALALRRALADLEGRTVDRGSALGTVPSG